MTQPSPIRSTSHTVIVWLVVLAVAGGAFGILATMNRARQQKMATAPVEAIPPVVTVSITRPISESIPDLLTATGTISAVDPMSVGPEVNGLRIESIDVEEGMRVRRGQVLARLNRATLEAQLAQAQARYQGSLAMLDKAVQPNRPQDILSLKAALEQARANEAQERANLRQAQANLTYSRRTARRYTEVRDEGFVTAQEAQDHSIDATRNQESLDAAQHRLAAARFASEQAAQRLNVAVAGGRHEDVENAQANTGEMKASIQLLNAQLEQTLIKAPDDGIVTERLGHIGDIVSSTKSLFSIARQGRLELKAQIPEVELQSIRVGDRAAVKVGKQTVTGKVWKISPIVDANTRLGTARILLNGNHVLPGMFASVTKRLGDHQALLEPGAAVLGDNDDHYLLTLVAGKAHKVKVSTGSRSSENVEIRSGGIQPTDEIILKGAGFLGDGDPVQVSQGTRP